MSIKTDEHDEKVLAAVKAKPGITARELAAFVFGGTGAVRTSSRGRAYHSLCRLRAANKVAAHPQTGENGNVEYAWRPVEERGDDPSIASHGAGVGP